MASHNVPDEVFIRTLQTVEKCGGSKVKAAKILKTSPTTVRDHLRTAERRGLTAGSSPFADVAKDQTIKALSDELDKLRKALTSANKPHFTVRQDFLDKSDTLNVLVIGDSHDDPTIEDKSRFEIAGKFCRDRKHDIILSIGDFLNTNSLCFHVPDENYSGKAKPTFISDMMSGKQALAALNSGLGSWNPERHITLGNHENRLFRMEDSTPSAWGMYQSLFHEVMTGAKFTYSPFGEFTYYGGVGFTHVPKTIMGKPYGGKHPHNSIGNDSVHDLVYGHTHVRANHIARKIGQKHVTIINAACYLPSGHVEDYAIHTPGGWHYGLTEITIKRGQIVESNFISLETLEERYGRKK